MLVEKIKESIEMDIMYGRFLQEPGKWPYRCHECGIGCNTIHLVPFVKGIRAMCSACYNYFVELVTPVRDRDWIPDCLCRGESIIEWLIRKVRKLFLNLGKSPGE